VYPTPLMGVHRAQDVQCWEKVHASSLPRHIATEQCLTVYAMFYLFIFRAHPKLQRIIF